MESALELDAVQANDRGAGEAGEQTIELRDLRHVGIGPVESPTSWARPYLDRELLDCIGTRLSSATRSVAAPTCRTPNLVGTGKLEPVNTTPKFVVSSTLRPTRGGLRGSRASFIHAQVGLPRPTVDLDEDAESPQAARLFPVG